MLRRRLLFSQTDQKNLLDDDAFDVSNVFFQLTAGRLKSGQTELYSKERFGVDQHKDLEKFQTRAPVSD